MSPFKKLIFIVVLAGVMLMTIYAYFIFLNTGQLEINAGTEGYTAYLNEVAYPCLIDPCSLKLKSGDYQLKVDKPGYYPVTQSVTIKRAGDSSLEISLEEIPTLKLSSFSRESDNRPSLPVTPEGTLGGIWNEAGDQFLFVDAADEKLKIRSTEGETKTVTTLKNLTPPLTFFWSPTQLEAIVADGNELYFVRTEIGSRNKFIASFEPTTALWTSAGVLLSDKEGAVYEVSLDNFNEAVRTDLTLDLDKTLIVSEDRLLTYQEAGRSTQIVLVDLTDNSETVIAEKLDFPLDDIYYDSALSIAYFRESDSRDWYEIKIQE